MRSIAGKYVPLANAPLERCWKWINTEPTLSSGLGIVHFSDRWNPELFESSINMDDIG